MASIEKKKEDANGVADNNGLAKKLECPFNWKMDVLSSADFTDYTPHDEEELVILLKLMRVIMTVYVLTKENEKENKIMEDLNTCDEIMAQLRKENDPQFSIEAIQHVLDATRYHVLKKFKHTDQVDELLGKIESADDLDTKLDRSTFYGCRSMGWSKYHRLGSEEAISFIRKAMETNEDCDLYNFILAKNLRRIRRDNSPGSLPGDEEKDAFLKAYNKSKSCVYGIFVAQMYRELRAESKAVDMYLEIYESKPNINTIYLRLALGFIQLYKLPLAKKCLDLVEPAHRNSAYHHYLGKYYIKVKNFQTGAYHLKIAAQDDNYPASRDYIRCMLRQNRNYDATTYLLDLLPKENFKNNQNLFIDLGLTYLKKRDFEKSVKYFHLAIKVDPNNQYLREYYSFYNPGRSDNVYNVISSEIFSRKNTLRGEAAKAVQELENYYKDYMKSQTDFMENSLKKVFM